MLGTLLPIFSQFDDLLNSLSNINSLKTSLFIYNKFMFFAGGSPHVGMEFNQIGGPMQAERGSSWIPGLRDNTTGTQNIPGPPSYMAGQMGPPVNLLGHQL